MTDRGPPDLLLRVSSLVKDTLRGFLKLSRTESLSDLSDESEDNSSKVCAFASSWE
eukprot:CAMPEP_0119033672 /NCGR_PEP_ID=MMETSP1177-20130426/731_1 /TAXON_ID=2985 /ORGANISM="Ochromonas sp, Strain CCMP1899" /LENGTH=55 /DNA_ID=CAMNT_0006990595 /DNA_START=120 /DNA_END=287 /DNA_ORIENTATION=+